MITQKSEGDRVSEAFDLAKCEGKKLQAKNPRHELLRLLAYLENNVVWDEFQNRFNSTNLSQEYFWGQYCLALKDALGVGDNVCFTEDAIANNKNGNDAWIGKIDPKDVFKIIALDSKGLVYLKGDVIYGNDDSDAVLISVDQSCLRKA